MPPTRPTPGSTRASLRDALAKLDFLVVQDMYSSTETAALADLLLPAAGWGEKEGTFINSERRVGLIKKVRRAPGQALSDFHIFTLAAHYYGCGELFTEWESPEAVFQILKRLSAGQPCDISGIADYHALDLSGGVQWPYPAENPTHARSDGCSRMVGFIIRTAEPGSFSTSPGRCRNRRMPCFHFSF